MCLIVSLLLIFAVYAEYKLLSILTSALSLGQVWVLVLVTALIGLHLLREQRDLNAKMQMKMMRGELNDPSELMLPITSLFSGLLLMIPGVLTDILGLALLYPPLAKILMRQAFKGGLNAFMANAQRGSGMGGGPFGGAGGPFGGAGGPFGGAGGPFGGAGGPFGGAGGPFGGAGSSQGSPDLSALFGGHVDPTQQAPSSSQATKSRTQRPQPKRKTPRSSSVDPSQVIIDVEGEVIED
jgi:UPF0716 family protein affecting phage T7 exclusion